jgi:hypothetical protein
VIDQRLQENLEYFKNFGSIIMNNARCAGKIKSRIDTVKLAFNKKKSLFANKLDSSLRKKLIKSYIWSIAFYGAKSWTLLKVDQTYFKGFEMWCCRKIEEIS